MPKTIRFTNLVAKSGKPQTAALWTKPNDNPIFLKAVRENRVLTVIQKPTGTQKDFGIMRFVQEQFALYLVFPKPLPKATEARVIGINYELIAEAAPNQSKERTAKKETATPRLRVPQTLEQKPIQKQFRITIVRSGREEVALMVRGQNIHEVEKTALQMVKRKTFQPQGILDEIKAIAEMSEP
jgi:hypothetical protein